MRSANNQRASSWRALLLGSLTLMLSGCGDGNGNSARGQSVEQAQPGDSSPGDSSPGDSPPGDSDRDDTNPSCDPALASSDCLLGAAFAECPGSGQPAAYCATSADPGGAPLYPSCRWISNGCPMEPFTFPLDPACECSGKDCPLPQMLVFVYGWGLEPWTRERALNIPVTLDASLNKPALPSLSCSGADLACGSTPNPCCSEIPAPAPAPVTLRVARRLPGTFVADILAVEAGGGWHLELEADLEHDPPQARVCRIAYTDDLQCKTPAGFPDCAQSGQLILSASPTAESLQEISGELAVTFAGGLQVTGSF